MSTVGAARALSRREEQGEASRARIRQAGLALMAERGFAGTSISALSRRCGLPASSIYWHFGSKAALLAAVMEEGAERWFEELPRWSELEGTPAEQADQMLAATATALERHPEFLRLLFLIALERREIDPAALAVVRRVRGLALQGLRRTVQALLPADGEEGAVRDPDQIAALALAMADGIFVQHHIDPQTTDVRALFAMLRAALYALSGRTPA